MRVINLTRYHTQDLARFFRAACKAMGCSTDKVFVVHPSKIGTTRGCADVGGDPHGRKEARAVAIEIAPPSKFTARRLARIVQHELLHTMGVTHRRMTRKEFWYRGGLPLWARGLKVRVRV